MLLTTASSCSRKTLPLPTLMQLRSCRSGVARRTRATCGRPSGSSCVSVSPAAFGSVSIDVTELVSVNGEMVSLMHQERIDDRGEKTCCLDRIVNTEAGCMSLAIGIEDPEVPWTTSPSREQPQRIKNRAVLTSCLKRGILQCASALCTGNLLFLNEQQFVDCDTTASVCTSRRKDKTLAFVDENTT